MEVLDVRNKATILVVDDEQDILQLIADILATQNYEVLTAVSAEKALSIIENQQVDIVITDENMPGMSGTELLSIMRFQHPDIISMMITGYADVETTIRAINDAQVYKFFTKPLRMTDLIISVKNALEHQQCMTEVNRLKRKVSEQKKHIAELEHLYPGITQLNKDPSGAIVIEE